MTLNSPRKAKYDTCVVDNNDWPSFQSNNQAVQANILMDAPFPLDELVLRAADRRGWARDTRSLSSLQESP